MSSESPTRKSRKKDAEEKRARRHHVADRSSISSHAQHEAGGRRRRRGHASASASSANHEESARGGTRSRSYSSSSMRHRHSRGSKNESAEVPASGKFPQYPSHRSPQAPSLSPARELQRTKNLKRTGAARSSADTSSNNPDHPCARDDGTWSPPKTNWWEDLPQGNRRGRGGRGSANGVDGRFCDDRHKHTGPGTSRRIPGKIKNIQNAYSLLCPLQVGIALAAQPKKCIIWDGKAEPSVSYPTPMLPLRPPLMALHLIVHQSMGNGIIWTREGNTAASFLVSESRGLPVTSQNPVLSGISNESGGIPRPPPTMFHGGGGGPYGSIPNLHGNAPARAPWGLSSPDNVNFQPHPAMTAGNWRSQQDLQFTGTGAVGRSSESFMTGLTEDSLQAVDSSGVPYRNRGGGSVNAAATGPVGRLRGTRGDGIPTTFDDKRACGSTLDTNLFLGPGATNGSIRGADINGLSPSLLRTGAGPSSMGVPGGFPGPGTGRPNFIPWSVGMPPLPLHMNPAATAGRFRGEPPPPPHLQGSAAPADLIASTGGHPPPPPPSSSHPGRFPRPSPHFGHRRPEQPRPSLANNAASGPGGAAWFPPHHAAAAAGNASGMGSAAYMRQHPPRSLYGARQHLWQGANPGVPDFMTTSGAGTGPPMIPPLHPMGYLGGMLPASQEFPHPLSGGAGGEFGHPGSVGGPSALVGPWAPLLPGSSEGGPPAGPHPLSTGGVPPLHSPEKRLEDDAVADLQAFLDLEESRSLKVHSFFAHMMELIEPSLLSRKTYGFIDSAVPPQVRRPIHRDFPPAPTSISDEAGLLSTEEVTTQQKEKDHSSTLLPTTKPRKPSIVLSSSFSTIGPTTAPFQALLVKLTQHASFGLLSAHASSVTPPKSVEAEPKRRRTEHVVFENDGNIPTLQDERAPSGPPPLSHIIWWASSVLPEETEPDSESEPDIDGVLEGQVLPKHFRDLPKNFFFSTPSSSGPDLDTTSLTVLENSLDRVLTDTNRSSALRSRLGVRAGGQETRPLDGTALPGSVMEDEPFALMEPIARRRRVARLRQIAATFRFHTAVDGGGIGAVFSSIPGSYEAFHQFSKGAYPQILHPLSREGFFTSTVAQAAAALVRTPKCDSLSANGTNTPSAALSSCSYKSEVTAKDISGVKHFKSFQRPVSSLAPLSFLALIFQNDPTKCLQLQPQTCILACRTKVLSPYFLFCLESLGDHMEVTRFATTVRHEKTPGSAAFSGPAFTGRWASNCAAERQLLAIIHAAD